MCNRECSGCGNVNTCFSFYEDFVLPSQIEEEMMEEIYKEDMIREEAEERE